MMKPMAVLTSWPELIPTSFGATAGEPLALDLQQWHLNLAIYNDSI